MAVFVGPATALDALTDGQLQQFRDVSGGWGTGALGGSNSAYAEGEAIPFRIEIPNDTVGSYTIKVCREFQNGTTFGYLFLEPYNTDRNPPLAPATAATNTMGAFTGAKVAAGDNITIDAVNETGGQGTCTEAGARETLVDVTLTGTAGDKFVFFGGHLAAAGDSIPGAPGTFVTPGKSAGFFSGASLGMRLDNQNRAINPGAIVQLGQITVQKVVDNGTATPDQFCFSINPNPAGETLPKCPAAGTDTVVFAGIGTAAYTITETTSPLGYTFASGNGTNCSFLGSTATASVTAAVDPVNATCVFHNRLLQGTLTVTKVVLNDDGGTAVVANFPLFIDDLAVTSGATNTLDAGDYTVSETNQAGYTGVISGDCAADGTITLSLGDVASCTITNSDVGPEPALGQIIIKKVADPYDTGKEFPFSSNFDGDANDGSDFTLEAGEELAFDLVAGTYSVTELVPAGWDLVSATCSDLSPVNAIVLAAEETVTCTFTNEKEVYDDDPGDPDFDSDTPFGDAGDPGTPAPTGDTAGTIDQIGTQQPAAPAPQPVIDNNVTTPQPEPTGPVALDQLPRTGQSLDRVTMLGALLLILGGLSVAMGRRRRRAHKA